MMLKKRLFLPSKGSLVAIAAALIIAPASTKAAVTVIDFEGLTDFSQLTTEIPGLIFSNATVASQLGSLNWPDFPPVSGDVVVVNGPGETLAVDFAAPVPAVGGYFTYFGGPLTLSFYGSGNVLLGTVASSFTDNWVPSGNPPNEYLQFSSLVGITRMEASLASNNSYSFTMDDLTLGAVPEPATAMINLILGGTGIGLTLRRRRR